MRASDLTRPSSFRRRPESSLFFVGDWTPAFAGVTKEVLGLLRHPDQRRAQQAVLDRVARLHLLDDRARLDTVVGDLDHRLVEMRIELLPERLDAADAVALEHIVQLAPRRLDARDEALHPLVLAQLVGDRRQR